MIIRLQAALKVTPLGVTSACRKNVVHRLLLLDMTCQLNRKIAVQPLSVSQRRWRNLSTTSCCVRLQFIPSHQTGGHCPNTLPASWNPVRAIGSNQTVFSRLEAESGLLNRLVSIHGTFGSGADDCRGIQIRGKRSSSTAVERE